MSRPFITVIIPMRNEATWLERCLGSVLAQDYPAELMEVLVADGMSDDGSRELLAEIAERDPRVRIVDNPGRIVPTGMNRAIEQARGEIIVRVDAHTVIEPDYVRTGVEVLQRTKAQNVGGPMICRGGGPAADAIAAAMRSRVGIGATFHFATSEVECDTVYMGTWPIEVFRDAGMFDEELVRNQDDELSYRIRKGGGRIVVTPAMRSSYQNRESWKALARQFYQYGVWKVRVLQKHPRQMSLRHFIPPAFQAAILGGLLLGLVWPTVGLLSLGVLTFYALTIAVAAVREAQGAAAVARVWLALVIIHQAWAAGFLRGLIRFSGRWLQPEAEARKLAAQSAASSSGPTVAGV